MHRRINEKSYMVAMRYGYILLFVICFATGYKRVNTFEIVCLLLFIINNQLRYFILPEKYIYTISSLVIEVFLCTALYNAAGSFGTIIFIPALMDVIYTFNITWALVFALGVMVFVTVRGEFQLLIAWITGTVPILLLLVRVKDEEIRKREAQILYDKLREKDEELKKANKELETYANTVEEIAVLRERNRISREIHDNVGHALSTIIIQLGAIEKIAANNGGEASKMAENLAEFAKESMEQVRADVRAMKPREFEEYEGIVAISEMIKNFEKLTGIQVNFRVSDKIWKLNSDQTMVIYRIVQEFLSNSLRHGKATKVKVFLNFLDTQLRVHLKDNGVGSSKVTAGVGLKSIKERVAVWGGEVEYFTEEGQGFELIVSMDKVKLSVDGV